MTTKNDNIILLNKKETYRLKEEENSLNYNKMQGRTFYTSKKANKNIPLKKLIFNPKSFETYKYPPKTLNLMNRKKINLEEKVGNSKNNSIIISKKDNKEYVYSMDTRKIKLKPLNKKRQNRSCSEILSRNDDIFIPSQKTSNELINYNMSNTHNTILNNYHKNNKNLKIINFVRTNSFFPHYNCSSIEKNIILNKSLNNSSGPISRNEQSSQLIQKNDSLKWELSINNKNTIEYANMSSSPIIENQKPNSKNKKSKSKSKSKSQSKNKNKIDYDSDVYSKKLPQNLKFFSKRFFQDNNLKNKRKNNNKDSRKSIYESRSRNNSNLKYQILDFKGKRNLIVTNLTYKKRNNSYAGKNKKEEDFRHIMKNPFKNNYDNFGLGINNTFNLLENNELAKKIQNLLLNPNTSKIRNNKVLLNPKLFNENKSMTYKELREISKKGFEKMEEEKYKKFNLLVDNTHKEVKHMEAKMEELFEENKKIFLDEKDDLNL